MLKNYSKEQTVAKFWEPKKLYFKAKKTKNLFTGLLHLPKKTALGRPMVVCNRAWYLTYSYWILIIFLFCFQHSNNTKIFIDERKAAAMRQDQRKEKLKKTHDVQLNDLVKHVQNVSFLLLLYTVFMSLFFFHGLFRSVLL